LGLTGQMHGSVFLDKQGNPIRPALLWNDARTGEECREIEQRVGLERLQAITGNPALAGFQAPKILWLRNHEFAAYRKVHHVLLPKDFIRFRLTNAIATDASDAAGTLLLDLLKRDWSDEILEGLKIPRPWLPVVYEGPEVTGEVTAEAARLTGLHQGLPVVAGGGDNAAAAVGSGVIEKGTASISLGTSGVVFVHTETPNVDPSGALHTFCHAVPGKYHLMGVVLSAGGSLQWFRDVFGVSQSFQGNLSNDPYEALSKEASGVPAGSEGLLFLPYLTGERTPHMDPNARGCWIGLSLTHRRPHLVRSIMEGVAFALKDTLTRIQALGVTPGELRTLGGGGRSDVWLDILAAVLDVPLRQLEIEEGASFGAALLAGVGSGVFADLREAVDRTVRLDEDVFSPNPELVSCYQTLYQRYIRLYPALKQSGLWD